MQAYVLWWFRLEQGIVNHLYWSFLHILADHNKRAICVKWFHYFIGNSIVFLFKSIIVRFHL